MVSIFGAFGFMTLTLIPYVSSRWEIMSWTISCYPMLIIFMIPFLPESFKWYFSKGQTEKGKKIYLTFCIKCNHVVDDDTLVRIIEENTYTDKKVYTMIDLTNYKVGCHYFKEKLQKKIFLWDKIARPHESQRGLFYPLDKCFFTIFSS